MSQDKDLYPFQPSELDNQVADFIANTAAEFAADEVKVDEAPVIESAPAETPHENTVLSEKPADPDTETATERGLERLVAREVELRERETRLSGTEKEIEALRTRLRELEPRALSPELLDKIKLSPHDGLRSLGLDPEEVIRTALAEKIGDKATPEMRDLLEKVQIKKELTALKDQVRQAEMKAQAQAYFAQVSNGAREFAGNATGISKHAPTVASVAARNPDRVYQEIMGEITVDAQVRSARGDQGDPITYEEAAKRVEARWAALKSLLGPNTVEVPPVSPGTPPASTPQATTKVSAEPVPQTKTTVTPKPPDRPIAPWLQRSVEDEDAIAAAIQEYRRVQPKT